MKLVNAVSDRIGDDPDDQSGTGNEDETVATADLSTDDIFHILQTKRRRDVLRYLQDTTGPVQMRDLAEQVAAWEQETTVEALSSSERQRVYISLYQSHLPKLHEEGVVEYDKDRGIVERTPVASQFDSYVDAPLDDGTDGRDRNQWPMRYTGAIALGVVVLAGVELAPVSLPGTAGGVLALALVSVVTVAHMFSE